MAPLRSRRKWWIDVSMIIGLIAIAILSCRKVLELWWTFDDPFHLNLISHRPVLDLLLGRSLWSNFPSHVFTPLLLVSLKADLAVAEFDARPFYLHHIASLVCIAPAIYLLIRQWVPPGSAACSALVAVLGVPMIECAQRLMDRHYLEGLLFAVLTALTFVIALRKDSRTLGLISAFLYLLSMAAKEIFVPLIVMLAVIPERSSRQRLRALIPHAAALALYCIWRIALLGPKLETYGWAVQRADWPRVIATLPMRVMRVLAPNVPGIVVVALIIGAVVIVAIRRPGSRLLLAAGIGCALIPILPVAFEIQPRYTLATWVLAAVAIAFLPRMRLAFALQIAIVVAGAISFRLQWTESFRNARRMSDEARAFAALGSTDLLWIPAVPPATLDELSRMTGSRAQWTYDSLPLCGGRMVATRFFAFDPAVGSVRETTRDRLLRACKSNRRTPLWIRFRYEQGSLFWDFGPYRDGRYRVIIADGKQGFDVPRHAGFHLTGIPMLPLRLRYESPAGWITYSDDLQVALKEGQTTAWRR